MDCHGAGGGWTFNSLVPDLLDPDCEFVVQEEWTELHGLPRGGLRRGALRRHARDERRRRRRAQPHRLRAGVAEPLVQRHARRRDGHQRRALRHWGVPVLLVTGDQRDVRRGQALLGDGLTTVAVKEGLGRYSARQIAAATRARDDRGRREARARRTSKAVPPYDPGSPCTIEVEYKVTSAVDKLRRVHGVEIVDARRIRSTRRHLVAGVAAVLLLRLAACDAAAGATPSSSTSTRNAVRVRRARRSGAGPRPSRSARARARAISSTLE